MKLLRLLRDPCVRESLGASLVHSFIFKVYRSTPGTSRFREWNGLPSILKIHPASCSFFLSFRGARGKTSSALDSLCILLFSASQPYQSQLNLSLATLLLTSPLAPGYTSTPLPELCTAQHTHIRSHTASHSCAASVAAAYTV